MPLPTNKPTDSERKRWFSTGYLARGVLKVNADQHVLENASVIQRGEARGHRLWIDKDFCSAVARLAGRTGDKGLKARFGHPDMCSDALGTFLGRWKNLKAGSDGVVRGNLFLSSTAAESPKGDLRNYVEQMAAKEPNHFGTSIVFSRDWEAEDAFQTQHTKEFDETDDTGKKTGNKVSRFQSPDPDNRENLRHARLSELHAGDLVDDPAATDGMFAGAGGAALASRISEFLDTHPEVFKALSAEPGLLEVLERYPEEIRPFVERWTVNHAGTPAKPQEPAMPEPTPTALSTPPAAPAPAPASASESSVPASSSTPAAEPAPVNPPAPPAESGATAQPLAAPPPAPAASEPNATEQAQEIQRLTAERDQLKKDLAESERKRIEAERKLAALTAGAPPVSAPVAEVRNQAAADPWKKAQKKT